MNFFCKWHEKIMMKTNFDSTMNEVLIFFMFGFDVVEIMQKTYIIFLLLSFLISLLSK
jgi:hypothetical protein